MYHPLVCLRDMLQAIQFQLFRYTKYYHRMQAQELVMDLLNDANVQIQVRVWGVGEGTGDSNGPAQ